MKAKITGTIIVLTLILFGGWAYYEWNQSQPAADYSSSSGVSKALGAADTAGFKRAIHGRTFHFPEDHGPHPAFKNEWWYYTGNLTTRSGRHFGYQFTIFRIGLKPGKVQSEDNWATHQFYMAHLALTDVYNHKFYAFQRFSRSALNLAGAEASPFHVWLDDWQVRGSGVQKRTPPMHITAHKEPIGLDLHLISQKPPVLEGDHGLSQKGTSPGNASYYYSLTRLKTTGTVRLKGQAFKVRGSSWMDREWGTTMLEKNQSGWDWFSLQLSNGWELMYYQLRKRNGRAESTSAGKLIRPDGSSVTLPYGSVKINISDYWKSSTTGTNYPSGWQLTVPSRSIRLNIDPIIKNQELRLSVAYWEGAVKIDGKMDNEKVTGNGYVELTGYGDDSAKPGY
ncbi:MAG TPA: lipocalin-like domain-containing protein [Balneolaceae bacterium]|nr:lipocalin-like domain-containing protein [Balneolaceae bacterium]